MKTLLAGLSSLVLLPASAVAAGTSSPKVPDLPARFQNQPAEMAPVAAVGWWADFNDPILNGLVAQALQGNPGIQQASARLQQAAAGVKEARGQRLPQLSVGASGAIQRLSIADQQGRVFSRVPGFQRAVEQYGLNGAANWEIDLFGRLSAGQRAALAVRQTAAADLSGVRQTIVAEVAMAYVTIRGLQERLSLLARREDTDARVAKLTRERVAVGIAPASDADAADAQLAGTRAQRLALCTALESWRNRLDVLIGRAPGEAAAALGEGSIPDPKAMPDPGSPASLLAARPDVVAAAALVAVHDAGVAQAIAARYPRFSITGFAGFLANGLASLLTAGGVQLGASAGISLPLFTGGRLVAQEAAAKARLAESVAGYRKATLAAIAEAEDAMAAQRNDRQQALLLVQAASALSTARRRASAAEEVGMTSRLDVLMVVRQQEIAEGQAIDARANAARAAIQTARTLGLPVA